MHKVFVYPSVRFAPDSHERATPDFVEAYAEFLAREFELEGIDPGRSVFWIYPRDYGMPALLQRFAPAYTVVDVVDDHRTWPGVSVADKQRLGDNYRDLLAGARSEEHTSELQSLMRISYAVFCLQKKKQKQR